MNWHYFIWAKNNIKSAFDIQVEWIGFTVKILDADMNA